LPASSRQVTPPQIAQATPPLPPPLPPAIREVKPTSRATVKVIDPGPSGAEQPKTLIEASRLAKAQKRAQAQQPIAQINDDNLAEFAEGADVIVLESEPAAPPPSDEFDSPDPLAEGSDLDGGDIRDEDYWRNRALELRMGWRRTIDELAELELESAALRQQFYAEEDPYIRDSQVKPSWDRTLDRLSTLRTRAQRYEQELDVFVEDGRRSGALQGWLNQGWELEPTDEEKELIGEPATLGISEAEEPDARDPVTGERYDLPIDPENGP
ncbi:MAG: hypothetical protein AAGM22_27145, partial [Acidobacteriota bacterium]